MHLKRKKGVIMVEVLMLLNILTVIIIYSAKTIASNSSKYKYYQIREDILTLSRIEEELIKEVETQSQIDEEMLKAISNYKDDITIKYKYVSENNSSSFLNIDQGRIYLEYINNENRATLRELDVKVIEENSSKKIILIPKLYKIII